MVKKSAGILLYREINNFLEIFLVHPGGPFWAKKDLGAWTIPKGEIEETERPFDAAKRELEEETGLCVSGDFIELTPVKQKNNKLIYAWALAYDLGDIIIKSNSFEIEWPPKSGKKMTFPEIDRGAWFNTNQAKIKIIQEQTPLITELLKIRGLN